jgi:hypothetical protein
MVESSLILMSCVRWAEYWSLRVQFDVHVICGLWALHIIDCFYWLRVDVSLPPDITLFPRSLFQLSSHISTLSTCYVLSGISKTNRLNTHPEKQILTLRASTAILPDHTSVQSVRPSPNLPTFLALPSTPSTRDYAPILSDHFILLWSMLVSNVMPSSAWV